jgi:hypothetical protein
VFEKTKPDYNVRFWLAEQYCGETIFKVRRLASSTLNTADQLLTFFIGTRDPGPYH